MTHSLAGSVSISSNKQISIEAFGVTESLTRSTKLNIYCSASKLSMLDLSIGRHWIPFLSNTNTAQLDYKMRSGN